MALISGLRFSGRAKPGGGVAGSVAGGRGRGRVSLASVLWLSLLAMASSLAEKAEGPQDDLCSEQQAASCGANQTTERYGRD
jgi:hypothetical protein